MQKRAFAGECTELFQAGALRFLVQVVKPTHGHKRGILLDTPTHNTLYPIVSYLCCHMDVGSFLQQQSHHVSVTLLGGQMKWGDSLLGQNVGLSPVVQQSGSYLHLVLLGSDMQRGVSILTSARRKRENKVTTTAM